MTGHPRKGTELFDFAGWAVSSGASRNTHTELHRDSIRFNPYGRHSR